MIIATDLMSELKLKIDYDTCPIEWDDAIVPMKQKWVVAKRES